MPQETNLSSAAARSWVFLAAERSVLQCGIKVNVKNHRVIEGDLGVPAIKNNLLVVPLSHRTHGGSRVLGWRNAVHAAVVLPILQPALVLVVGIVKNLKLHRFICRITCTGSAHANAVICTSRKFELQAQYKVCIVAGGEEVGSLGTAGDRGRFHRITRGIANPSL